MNSKIIPYGKQHITEQDILEVVNALKSDYLTQGPRIQEFEYAFSKYMGSTYAVAVSNGTAALHLSAMVLGVNKSTKVITTPITFAASANCIRYCDGEVVFSDIDPKSYLIDINKIRELLEKSPKNEFSGIISVDFAGRPVNLQELKKLADEYGLWIIEDACHAPGGYFKDNEGIAQHCGNGKFADLAVFSFHPVKHIAAGEGGMITTNDKTLYEKLLKLRTHGITRDEKSYLNSKETVLGKSEVDQKNWPGWYMEMQDLGFNYRLTDFQAALGNSQLQRLGRSIDRRREFAKIYTRELSQIEEVIRTSGIVEGHAYHLFVVEVENRYDLYNYLRKNNVFTQIHYIPAHFMPYYKQYGWKVGDMPFAESYYDRCLSLPMYPTLEDSEVEYVINTIKSFYSK